MKEREFERIPLLGPDKAEALAGRQAPRIREDLRRLEDLRLTIGGSSRRAGPG
jgi:hypothetical protein